MQNRDFGARKIEFYRKRIDFTRKKASLWLPINMLLSSKSMHISPLKHCFWWEKTCKVDMKQHHKFINTCVWMIYKNRSFWAYLRQEAGLFANSPSMKRLVVKKIYLHLPLKSYSSRYGEWESWAFKPMWLLDTFRGCSHRRLLPKMCFQSSNERGMCRDLTNLRAKKKSTAVLSILLTLNLILWKTHCKVTKWFCICKLWP